MHRLSLRIIIGPLIGAGIGYSTPFFTLMAIPCLLQTFGSSLPPESLRSFAMMLASSQATILSTLMGAFVGFGGTIVRPLRKKSPEP